MSAHMRKHPTSPEETVKVVIVISKGEKRTSYIPSEDVFKLEKFLEKYSIVNEEEQSIDWKNLAKDKIKKYKKAGIVLRGARYREGISQKKLAEKSRVSQEDISKIENGKRPVGEKVAKRLSRVLHIDYRLLIDS